MCCSRGTVSYIPCSHILRGILVLALSSVSSGCVCGCVCVCEQGHIWLAFDLGEALRCMPRCERLGCSLLSPYPVTLWQRLLYASSPYIDRTSVCSNTAVDISTTEGMRKTTLRMAYGSSHIRHRCHCKLLECHWQLSQHSEVRHITADRRGRSADANWPTGYISSTHTRCCRADSQPTTRQGNHQPQTSKLVLCKRHVSRTSQPCISVSAYRQTIISVTAGPHEDSTALQWQTMVS